MTSRSCLVLVLTLGLPSLLFAQKEKGSWSDLNRLKAGQGIEVIEHNMKRHAGEFVTATEEVLSFQENGSDVSLKRDDVVRVSTSSGPRRGEHALIGLLVGGGIGAAIGASAGSSHGFLGGSSRGRAALVGIVIGAPSGALVGALIPAHTTVYRASGRRAEDDVALDGVTSSFIADGVPNCNQLAQREQHDPEMLLLWSRNCRSDYWLGRAR